MLKLALSVIILIANITVLNCQILEGVKFKKLPQDLTVIPKK